MVNRLFINLPVADVARSTAFFYALGFESNVAFSNEQAECIVLGPDMHVNLLSQAFMAAFSTKPLADAHQTTQVMVALHLDSADAVKTLVETALQHGATHPRPAADHGWMYHDCFADLDGHQWEIAFMDLSQFPQQ